MEIYVGSIPFKWKEKDLIALFEPFGKVESAKIVIDNITRQNKGFAFVTMPEDREAYAAIAALNGKEFLDRKINVTKSVSKDEQRKLKHKAEVNKSKRNSKSGIVGKGGGFRGFGKPSSGRRSS
jgi:RNA recognition motif-containing protein